MRDTDKLVKVLTLAARTDKPGEAVAALKGAQRMLDACGASWKDVIAPVGDHEPTVEDLIAFCLDNNELLSAWEYGFVRGIRGRQHLTVKQLTKLRELAAQVEDRRAAA